MMTFCYNDQTSTKTARTAAVFRHDTVTAHNVLHTCCTSSTWAIGTTGPISLASPGPPSTLRRLC